MLLILILIFVLLLLLWLLIIMIIIINSWCLNRQLHDPCPKRDSTGKLGGLHIDALSLVRLTHCRAQTWLLTLTQHRESTQAPTVTRLTFTHTTCYRPKDEHTGLNSPQLLSHRSHLLLCSPPPGEELSVLEEWGRVYLRPLLYLSRYDI